MQELPLHTEKQEVFKREWFFGTASIPKGDFFAAHMQAISAKPIITEVELNPIFMKELEPRFLQVGDILFEADIQQEYEIHRVTPKFAVSISTSKSERWFRKELCRNNGVWKTCLKGDKFDAFILNEKPV